ncbi:mediator of RNA polymerase II transcription subunit 25-like protein isoform X1 [Tanacetum coccineum]
MFGTCHRWLSPRSAPGVGVGVTLTAMPREFCSHVTSTSTGPSSCGQCLLYLVVCGSPDPMKSSAANVIVPSSIESFLFILSELAFFDQGAPALEEGLACALKCILVTASEASVGPKFVEVPYPPRDTFSALAAMLAGSFVPLSVICWNGLPRMRDIYTAGNNFNQTYGDFAIEFEHPGHLILMSEKFPGSRRALMHLKTRENNLETRLQMLIVVIDSICRCQKGQLATSKLEKAREHQFPGRERKDMA